MARGPSESRDNIAAFYESIGSRLDTDDSIFLGGAVLSRTECQQVQKELRTLIEQHRAVADEYHSDGR